MKIECTVCLETIQATALSISCGHIFHEACLQNWASRDQHCPNCRQAFTAAQYRTIYLTNQLAQDSILDSTIVTDYRNLQEDLLSAQAELEREVAQLRAENEKLVMDQATAVVVQKELRAENQTLKARNQQLRETNQQLELTYDLCFSGRFP